MTVPSVTKLFWKHYFVNSFGNYTLLTSSYSGIEVDIQTYVLFTDDSLFLCVFAQMCWFVCTSTYIWFLWCRIHRMNAKCFRVSFTLSHLTYDLFCKQNHNISRIYASVNWAFTRSNNDSSPDQCQCFIWTNSYLLLIQSLQIYFPEIWIEIRITKYRLSNGSGLPSTSIF